MSQRRFSRQLNQEQISRHQIGERLVEFGWVATTPSIDLGEDYIVHVYHDGHATGVTFHVQAKSVTNLVQRRKGDVLPYQLKVKDLKHWGEFRVPVVLVIWDIKLREGRCALIADVIARLNVERPGWRENKSRVRVHIPWANTLDDIGLNRLKEAVGWHFYPQIAADRSLELKANLTFPNTPAGQTARAAFERHIKEGEPVVLQGRIIQELRFSQWWEEWFGGYDPDKVVLGLGPLSSDKRMLVDIEVEGNNRENASLSGVEFRAVRVGTELLKLSNDHQNLPLHFTITIRKSETMLLKGVLSLVPHGFGSSVYQVRNAVSFLHVVSRGGRMRLVPIDGSDQPLSMLVDPQPSAAPDARLVDLVDKLCVIQSETNHFIKIPEQGFTPADVDAVNELYQIVRTGSTTRDIATLTIEFMRDGIEKIVSHHRPNMLFPIVISYLESYVELFDENINTGPMIRHVTGTLGTPVDELKEMMSCLSEDEFFKVSILNAEIIESFSNWPKNNATINENRAADK